MGNQTPVIDSNQKIRELTDNQKNANGIQIGFGYNLKTGPVGFYSEFSITTYYTTIFI